MLSSSPFIMFDGECAEAMEFYHECFGGEITLTKVSDTPMKDQFPPEKLNRIIYGNLKSGNIDISATDWMSDEVMRKTGNNITIYIVGDAGDEFKSTFEKLSAGAQSDETYQALHELPFGEYGQFTDKYGIAWIFKGNK